MTAETGRAERLRAVVAGVVRQHVGSCGAAGVVLLDDGSAQAELAADWCAGAVGGERLDRCRAGGAAYDAMVAAGASGADAHRMAAHLQARRTGALLADPASKTALLLEGVPPAQLFPLGDLYATQVEALCGAAAIPQPVRELAERVGGVPALDRILMMLLEERRSPASILASEPAAQDVLNALDRGRWARRYPFVVPKLSARTIGIDLFV